MAEHDLKNYAREAAAVSPFAASWGEIRWIFDASNAAGAEMTIGRVTIEPGEHNPLHSHPNCEEVLFVLSGECVHLLDGDEMTLRPGSAIRIPRGVKHLARCTSAEPLVALIAFSSPVRETVNHEGGDLA